MPSESHLPLIQLPVFEGSCHAGPSVSFCTLAESRCRPPASPVEELARSMKAARLFRLKNWTNLTKLCSSYEKLFKYFVPVSDIFNSQIFNRSGFYRIYNLELSDHGILETENLHSQKRCISQKYFAFSTYLDQ